MYSIGLATITIREKQLPFVNKLKQIPSAVAVCNLVIGIMARNLGNFDKVREKMENFVRLNEEKDRADMATPIHSYNIHLFYGIRKSMLKFFTHRRMGVARSA